MADNMTQVAARAAMNGKKKNLKQKVTMNLNKNIYQVVS